MKKISQKEFEERIEEIISGKLTRRKLCTLLDTDMRTLNNKILELSDTNPEIYKRFINKFPYKPKTINVGSANNLAIYVIENGLESAVEKYGVSIRTISRKVKTLEIDCPELYRLYRERTIRDIKQEELEPFRVEEEKIAKDKLDEKRYELTLLLTEFERLLKEGKSKAEAARIMGYDDYPTIWKKANELKRITTEEKTTQKTKIPKSRDDEEPER